MRTFFVETYVPKLDAEAAGALTSRLRSAVEQLKGEGLPLAWIRSLALLDEDTYIWMIEATEVDHVLRVHRHAGIDPDHVAEALPDERPWATCPSRGSRSRRTASSP